PETFISTEEREVNSSSACGLNVRAFGTRPVFVVADHHVNLVVEHQASTSSCIDAREIADVITIVFQPTHDRILRSEYKRQSLEREIQGMKGPVIANLESSIVDVVDTRRTIKATSHRYGIRRGVGGRLPFIVRLPGFVRRLEQDLRMIRIIPHDENNE